MAARSPSVRSIGWKRKSNPLNASAISANAGATFLRSHRATALGATSNRAPCSAAVLIPTLPSRLMVRSTIVFAIWIPSVIAASVLFGDPAPNWTRRSYPSGLSTRRRSSRFITSKQDTATLGLSDACTWVCHTTPVNRGTYTPPPRRNALMVRRNFERYGHPSPPYVPAMRGSLASAVKVNAHGFLSLYEKRLPMASCEMTWSSRPRRSQSTTRHFGCSGTYAAKAARYTGMCTPTPPAPAFTVCTVPQMRSVYVYEPAPSVSLRRHTPGVPEMFTVASEFTSVHMRPLSVVVPSQRFAFDVPPPAPMACTEPQYASNHTSAAAPRAKLGSVTMVVGVPSATVPPSDRSVVRSAYASSVPRSTEERPPPTYAGALTVVSMSAVRMVVAAARTSTLASRIELAGPAAAPVRFESVAPPVAVPATTVKIWRRWPVASRLASCTVATTRSMRGLVPCAAVKVAVQLSDVLGAPTTPELVAVHLSLRLPPYGVS